MAMREMRWTDEQAAAITASGDVLLAASAGTGKTTTIVGKILWLLGLDVGLQAETETMLPPCPEPATLEEIAAITFTEKAAYDLKRKLRAEVSSSERGNELRWQIDRASVGTIHGFCAEILREHALRLGVDPTFRILDEMETTVQQDELIRDVLMRALERREPEAVELVKRFNLFGGHFTKGAVDHVREVLRDIRWHARRYEPWVHRPEGPHSDPTLHEETLRKLAEAEEARTGEPAPESAEADALAVAAALYRYAFRSLRRWLAWLEEENVRDFDSLILDARRLLTRQETRPALEAIRGRYRILIIDEFQDTDAAQKEIAFAIAGLPDAEAGLPDEELAPGRERPQVFLVGDPKQSIYRFRGADISVWNRVRQTLCGGGEPLHLTSNFRSQPQVVALVNRVCSAVMTERAEALAKESPASRVDYKELQPARGPTRAGGLEWLVNDGRGKDELVEAEARLVASRIQRLVGNTPVWDDERQVHRPCRRSDIAVLGRTREALAGIEEGLRQYGVRFYNTATGGLADRQEIMDLVTALRVVENPRDDLRAFAFLRSPFVGLRDEVLTRIRLDRALPRTTYLRQARAFLERTQSGELSCFEAPESPLVSGVELEALCSGLQAVEDAHRLLDRADHAELLEALIQRTGYRLQLLLREGAAESMANLERFLAMLGEYRHLPLAAFLRLWDRWGEQDMGIPQAPLFSHDDDVVTLSTIHTAKGLEWPVVFLVRTREGPGAGGRLTNTFWSDPDLGPVFMPPKDDRGDRSRRLFDRALLEDHAEEARLLYVAATRARDRLVVSGPTEDPKGYAAWLAPELDEAFEERQATAVMQAAGDGDGNGNGNGESLTARASRILGTRTGTPDDAATGTGRQIDAFGFDHEVEDETGQFSLFAPGSGIAAESERATWLEEPPAAPLSMVIYRTPDPLQGALAQAPVSLAWMENLEECAEPPLVRPIPVPPLGFTTSATEMRIREKEPERWERFYRHGVVETLDFAREAASGRALRPTVRGTLIHGVLERIEEEAELSRILDETIAGLDDPGAEVLLTPGTAYREVLEAEIARVVRSPEWAWYVEGVHWRELTFVHLAARREWRLGALDLLRAASYGPEAADRDCAIWIVDFKTHQIDAEAAANVAREYETQARVYREVVRQVLGEDDSTVQVALHFTAPNVVVEM
jgi:ATP-dependent exoDNAse (exonuclease V) beta subunit